MFPKDPFDVFQKGFQLFKTSAAVVLQMNILLHLAHANELVNGKKRLFFYHFKEFVFIPFTFLNTNT